MVRVMLKMFGWFRVVFCDACLEIAHCFTNVGFTTRTIPLIDGPHMMDEHSCLLNGKSVAFSLFARRWGKNTKQKIYNEAQALDRWQVFFDNAQSRDTYRTTREPSSQLWTSQTSQLSSIILTILLLGRNYTWNILAQNASLQKDHSLSKRTQPWTNT